MVALWPPDNRYATDCKIGSKSHRPGKVRGLFLFLAIKLEDSCSQGENY